MMESVTIMVFDDDKNTFYNSITDTTFEYFEDYVPLYRHLESAP